MNYSTHKKRKKILIESFENAFLQSWWVILFCILTYMLYEQGLKQVDADYAKLHEQWLDLKMQKEKALSINQSLHLQINSQSDPAWVELTLMKGLGVVPEGQTKILFIKRKVKE